MTGHRRCEICRDPDGSEVFVFGMVRKTLCTPCQSGWELWCRANPESRSGDNFFHYTAHIYGHCVCASEFFHSHAWMESQQEEKKT